MCPRPNHPDPPLRCSPLAELLPRLCALPEERRAEVIRHAEQLHDTLDPDGTFPFDYVAFRLTGFRRDYGDDALLVGEAVRHDLRWAIDTLGKTTPLPIRQDGARPADDWAMRLNVNPKTLRRWRDAGLRWRWLKPAGGGRRVLGHTADAIDHFKRQRPDRFAKAIGFTQMDAETRETLINQAKELANAQPHRSLNDVAKQLAGQHDRAHETVRLLLEKHDRQHPGSPLFPSRQGPLDPTQLRELRRLRRQGLSIAKLAPRLRKSPAVLQRALLIHRAAVVRRVPLPFVPSPLFDRPDADDVFLRDTAPRELKRRKAPPRHDDLPEALRPLFDAPALDRDQLHSAYLRYNFLKAKAARHRDALPKPYLLRASELSLIENAIRQAGRTRRELMRGQFPAVLSLARRQLTGDTDASRDPSVALLRLLNTALPVLSAAVEAFNASGNTRPGTFLRNRLQRAFATLDPAGSQRAGQAIRRQDPDALTRRLLEQARDFGLLIDASPSP